MECKYCSKSISKNQIIRIGYICNTCLVNNRHKKAHEVHVYKKCFSINFMFLKRFAWLVGIAIFIVFSIATKGPDVGFDCGEAGWVHSPNGVIWSDTLYQLCEQRRQAKVKSLKAEMQSTN
jgi:hypothetical protein